MHRPMCLSNGQPPSQWRSGKRILILCETAIDIVVDLGDLMVGMDDDGRGLVVGDTSEACHDLSKVPSFQFTAQKQNIHNKSE